MRPRRLMVQFLLLFTLLGTGGCVYGLTTGQTKPFALGFFVMFLVLGGGFALRNTWADKKSLLTASARSSPKSRERFRKQGKSPNNRCEPPGREVADPTAPADASTDMVATCPHCR